MRSLMHPTLEQLTIAIALASLVAALAAVVLAWVGIRVMRSQLWAARGLHRGVQLNGGYTGCIESTGGSNAPSVKVYRVSVFLARPGSLTGARPWIRGVPKSIEEKFRKSARDSLTCTDDPIELTFRLREGYDTQQIRWGLRWVEPHKQGVRTQFVATRLDEPTLWMWQWRRPYYFWFWYEGVNAEVLGADPKPLGRWKKQKQHDLVESQNPLRHLP